MSVCARVFRRVLRRVSRPDIVRALIGVSVVKNDPVLEMVMAAHSFPVSFTFPPLLSSSLPAFSATSPFICVCQYFLRNDLEGHKTK